jgi:hypothetical protein
VQKVIREANIKDHYLYAGCPFFGDWVGSMAGQIFAV